MQFSALLSRLKTVLAQYSSLLANPETTNYWTDSELAAYLNMAYREFCAKTRITHKHISLGVTDEGNSYVLPEDLMEIVAVRYEGKPLDQKSIKYLETAYSGTSHFEAIKGEGRLFNGFDWRAITGYPDHWYFGDGYLHCFPRPEEAGEYSGFSHLLDKYRKVFVGSVQLNSNIVSFYEQFPTHAKNLVDIYINGVYASPSTWTLGKTYMGSRFVTSVTFNDALDFEGTVTAVVWNTPVLTQRFYSYLTNGAVSKTFTDVVADNLSIRVMVNGNLWIESVDYTYTYNNNNLVITFLDFVGASDDVIDVMVYDIQPDMNPEEPSIVDGKVDIDYIFSPSDLAEDDDVPVIPQTFHDAIWQYAAYLALTREGQQTQDFQKAAVYREMFDNHVARANKLSQPPVDVDFPVNQPFFV